MSNVISENFTKGRNDLVFEQISKFDGRKLRANVRRNAYDFQSHASVELWTDAGWTQVVRMAGEHPAMAALPTYVTSDLAAAQVQLKTVALMLLVQAHEIV